jgi:hypothetical protein
MIGKTLGLLALLVVVAAASVAKADTTENVTFGYSGGSLTGTETLHNGQVTSVSIDGFTLSNLSGPSNLLLQGCNNNCSWTLANVFGTIELEVSSGNSHEYATCPWCASIFGSGIIKSGSNYGPSTSMPEPPVYLLALLGIFFTRNRISQGLRQALRWSN